MGDSGSQVIGFTLAALGLAVELHRRLVDGRNAACCRCSCSRSRSSTRRSSRSCACSKAARSRRAGATTSSHRLVSLGLSETHAVVLLALVSAALGATSLAYEAFGTAAARGSSACSSASRCSCSSASFLANVERETPGATRVDLHAAPRRGARRRRADRGVVPRRLPPPLQRRRHAESAPLLPADAPGAASVPLPRAARASACTPVSGATRARATRCAPAPPSPSRRSSRSASSRFTQGPIGDFSRSVLRHRRADLHAGARRRALRGTGDRTLHRAGAPRKRCGAC